jgi:hypothetical protein
MTTITWPSPFGYVIFCDDVREEVGGKLTIVGAYGADMVIAAILPVTIAKFAMVVKYFERPGESTEPVRIEVYFPGDEEGKPATALDLPVEEIRNMPPPKGYKNEDLRIGTTFQVLFPPTVFQTEGFVRVQAIRGQDIVRLGRLRVTVNIPKSD